MTIEIGLLTLLVLIAAWCWIGYSFCYWKYWDAIKDSEVRK